MKENLWTKPFLPAPEGKWGAVCVDVIDLGGQQTAFGLRGLTKVVWEIEARMEDGRRFIVAKKYTCSLRAQSNLYRDLVSWRGTPFTATELRLFDPESLVGRAAQLTIRHFPGVSGLAVRVEEVAPAGEKILSPAGNYVRVRDRVSRSDLRPFSSATSVIR